MFYRILIYVLGVISLSIGLSMMIIYASLFGLGFSLEEYFEYLLSNYTFYFIPIGMLLICFGLFFDSKWKKFIQKNRDQRHF